MRARRSLSENCHVCGEPETVGELWSIQYGRYVALCDDCYDLMEPTLRVMHGDQLLMRHFNIGEQRPR